MLSASLLGSKALWYFGRGSGLILIVLLTVIVLLGVSVRTGAAPGRTQRFVVVGLHKNLALFSVLLGAIHILTLELDPFVSVGWLGAFVPFASPYRTLWLAFGALGLDAIVAVIATSLIRHRLGHRYWKGVHLLAYAAWPLSLVHALGSGSDTRLGWTFALQMACMASVAVAGGVRLAKLPKGNSQGRLVAASALVLLPVGLFAWAFTGPFQPGWARKAGTPTSLLSTGGPGGISVPPTTARESPFSGYLIGNIYQAKSAPRTTVIMTGVIGNGVLGSVKVTLAGSPSPGGGVVLSSGNGIYRAIDGSQWSGPVVSLDGGDVLLHLSPETASGASQAQTLYLSLHLSISGNSLSGSASGTFRAAGQAAPTGDDASSTNATGNDSH